MTDPKSSLAVLALAPGGERFSVTTAGETKPNIAALALAPGGGQTSTTTMADSNFHAIAPVVPRGPAVDTPGRGAPARPPTLAAVPDTLGLLRALRRRWRIALALGSLLAALAGAASWYAVPRAKYTARATLHVSTNPKYIIFDPKERLADFRTYQQTQMALARSRFVLADALKKPEVAQLTTIRQHIDADEWLAEQIKISFPGNSEVLEISLNGDHPADLAKLVNAVVDSYLSLVVDEEQKERRARLDKLRELWTRYQQNLQTKREAMRGLAAAVGSNDKKTLDVANQSKIQHRDMAVHEQQQVELEIGKAESELSVLEDRIKKVRDGELPSAAIDMRIEGDPAILELKHRIQRIRGEYAVTEKKVRSRTDPALLRLRTHLDAVQRELADTRSKLRPAVAAEIRAAALKDDWANAAKLRAQISVAKTYNEVLEKNIERLGAEAKHINRGGLDLSQQQDEIQIVSETARRIGAEVEAMEVELGAPSRIRVVDRAAVPTKKDELRKVKISGAASAGAFTLVLLGISFWEFRVRRIDSVAEVVQGLGLRIVGALPPLPDSPRRRAGSEERHLQSRMVESIDAARALILHASRVESVRVLMITSAVKGEGKTSLACHLATSLARAGRRTLLVDCDLRSPSVHRLLDLAPEPGLSEILRGEVDAADTIQPTPAGWLHLIPAGRSDALAIQALAQDRLRVFFEDLRGRYDFIIVDSAPLLPVADSLPVSQIVDAVIFSILRDVSRLPTVHAASERLAALGVRTLGAVVSGATDESDGYGYPHVSLAYQ